ncbi:hypothetical protein TCAL_07934 [Tigriopus californicus]|uniref:Innexin n=1 Tax=Tigriopus californicus TaxID=6832 RepID=A0A553NEC0_TIGCA|nr:innexin inx2-like [Tigriopus californicus]TRY63796.1 hypothetical protein TCAL_07934 [Tigriopus californicus]|eukprot:TCALIF_07934-PA protein Name:"Similar to Inx2 Innexin inx2 (Drosophila melanogaster)" AED:0.06 eAED:0.08 QI:0/-1/0/1/-1/1/1/0/529
MFSLFGSVKGSIKLPSVNIDNALFRLHYKVSFVFLFACAILVTAKQYLGDPIDCIVEEIPQNVMDTYCWIHSTFSITNAVFGREGFDNAHPGVAPPNEESFQYHKYYQWVALTLFFQACLFYLPHYIWKYCEDHKMKILTEGICVPIVDNEVRQSRINALVAYCIRNKGKHDPYAMKFYMCELLNFINIMIQIFFTDFFLDEQFTKYGSEVVYISEKDLSERGDPLDRVFPKVAKCTFHKFGPSGTIEKFDGLCILPLNIINEKIYVFLWFWFIILAIISGFHALYRLAMICMPNFRKKVLKRQAKMTVSGDLEELCKDMKLGDWFLFHQLARNVDSFIFAKFVQNYLRPEEDEAQDHHKPKDNEDPEKVPLIPFEPHEGNLYPNAHEVERAMNTTPPSGQSPTTSKEPNASQNENTPLPAPSIEQVDPSPSSSEQPNNRQVASSPTPSSESPSESRVEDDPANKDPLLEPVKVQVLKETSEPSKSAETQTMSSQMDREGVIPSSKSSEVPKSEASFAMEEKPSKSYDT